MLDIDLLIRALKNRGHKVGHVNHIPENAGQYEFEIDDRLLTLAQVRAMLEEEAESSQAKPS